MIDFVFNAVTIALLVVYGVTLLFIFIYSLAQANLVYLYQKSKRKHKQPAPDIAEYPFVTVQLPVYNELYVVERIIDAAAAFRYPQDKFEIQVLDDSTDETTELVELKIANLRANGINIFHIRRSTRDGFKAGALAHGLLLAKGELIAVFDADFIPPPDFLLKTVPYFENKEVGLVQTKWEHVNADYSMLTRLQAFALDAHFTIEQQGRYSGGHFINFNGTAGVWRKTCIIDAGNWQADTLTEDLDLSYRAQLKGWKFLYLEHVGSPAELPVTISALRTQQFRWTKGAAECVKKNLFPVLLSRHVPALTKFHALFHLMNCSVFICILLSALIGIPLLFIKATYPQYAEIFLYASFSPLSFLFLSYFYWVSAAQKTNNSFLSFLAKYPLFLSVSMGFSLHNSIALFEGYIGKSMPFIRTPKLNITSSKDKWQGHRYLIYGISGITILEGLLFLYFAAGIYFSIYFNNLGMLPFYAMLVLGFGYVFYYSIAHSVMAGRYLDG